MTKIMAVITDMDGTLLNPDHRISDYTTQVLKRLRSIGVSLIVATGRPYADVFAVIRQCGLQPDYIITSNGANIHDGNFQLVSETNIDPKIVQEIISVAQQPNEDGSLTADCPPKTVATNVNRNHEWLADKYLDICVKFDESYPCQVMGPDLYKLQESDLQGVHQVWFLGEPLELDPMEKYLRRKYGGQLRCTYSLPIIFDCVVEGVNKGRAVKEVCAKLGFDVLETAVFGDGMNDESMLAIAGYPFIMANAAPKLKAALPHAPVIGSNAEDGVAKKLEEMFFLASDCGVTTP